MADITGPTSALPGTQRKLPAGATCDDHPDRLAVVRIQGETDSFGAELIDWCQECYDQYLRQKDDPEYFHTCERCGVTEKSVTAARDPGEGICGPVYYWCAGCRNHKNSLEDEEDEEPPYDPYELDYDLCAELEELVQEVHVSQRMTRIIVSGKLAMEVSRMAGSTNYQKFVEFVNLDAGAMKINSADFQIYVIVNFQSFDVLDPMPEDYISVDCPIECVIEL